MEEVGNNSLTAEELEKVKALIDDYRSIYQKATTIGKQIEDLQADMVKVSVEMTNKSNEENLLYKEIANRIGIEVEEARNMIMKELEKNQMNQMQN